MVNKQKVAIKGTKDGLTFLLDDDCSFEELLEELKDKLENSHQSILSGPLMRVIVKTGYRKISAEQLELIKNIFKAKGNLLVQAIENEIEEMKDRLKSQVKVLNGIIRSGQVAEVEGNVLLLGDVNPGGNLLATGDIYILGALKGTAHAGRYGDQDAKVISLDLQPQQLRIAEFFYSFTENKAKIDPPVVAYLKDGEIIIEHFQHFNKLKKAFGPLI